MEGSPFGAAARYLSISLAVALGTTSATLADPPTLPIGSFSTAKKRARNIVYVDRRETFYCGCRYAPSTSSSGGLIDHSSCAYETRKNAIRAARLEWEHIVPAHRFGGNRPCWTDGHPTCVHDGDPFSGRKCCAKSGVDPEFRMMENDLHNLVPSVGEVNGDRSNHPFGVVDGEPRFYGACDFELGGTRTRVEASDDRRGDIARAYLYMAETYEIELTAEEIALVEEWHSLDPPDELERQRDARIQEVQGNTNPFVRRPE